VQDGADWFRPPLLLGLMVLERWSPDVPRLMRRSGAERRGLPAAPARPDGARVLVPDVSSTDAASGRRNGADCFRPPLLLGPMVLERWSPDVPRL